MSSIKRWKLKNIMTSNGSCGCGPKEEDVIQPKPKFNSKTSDHQNPSHHCPTSSSVRSCPKLGDSFAVVKDSDDPYQDFKQSMLQMILEKEIYSKDDLLQLLDCFLQLNAPNHHEVIVRAFMEVWNNGCVAREGSPLPCPSSRAT